MNTQAINEVKSLYLAEHGSIGKIRAIRLVRAIAEIGLREAKDIVENWGEKPQVFYIHKGRVTDLDAYSGTFGVRLGDTEWQLSDARHNRTFSYDFLSLEEALSSYPNAKFYWVG